MRFRQKTVLGSLAVRRISALSVFSSPAFKRELHSPAVRSSAVNFLKKHLNKGFFNSLPRIMDGYHSPSYKVREFVFKRKKFVVKDTEKDVFEGFVEEGKENGIRKFMKSHHAFFRRYGLREKVHYILRTPKLIAQIDNYLIIEKIKIWHPKTASELKLVEQGFKEMRNVFSSVYSASGLLRPQLSDFIPAGIHKGKAVFYCVYDFA